MKALVIAAALAIVLPLGCAEAQSASSAAAGMSRPTVGIGSKTMASCTADKQKVCPEASDCQDALGTPFDGVPRNGG